MLDRYRILSVCLITEIMFPDVLLIRNLVKAKDGATLKYQKAVKVLCEGRTSECQAISGQRIRFQIGASWFGFIRVDRLNNAQPDSN